MSAVKEVNLELTEDEIRYLEPYVFHALGGVMAQNKFKSAKEKHIWSNGTSTVPGNLAVPGNQEI